MAGIRWARGFFRLWMLVAVLWVGAGAVLGVGGLMNPYVERQILLVPAATNELTMVPRWSAAYPNLQTLVAADAIVETELAEGYSLYTRKDMSWPRLNSLTVEGKVLVASHIQEQTAAQRSKMAPSVVGWVLLPPTVLLAFGWAIGWAISGFRRTSA